ncbi:MAG: beta-ketoacyl-[acyl-carrier-protein] synthase family protein, partial [Myxococcota bacterium]
MPASVNEVVVTGLGVVSAAGPSFLDLAEALSTGRQCASPVESPLPITEWAAVPGSIPEHPGFENDRKAWLAFAALDEALLDADLPSNARTSVFLGTGLSSITPEELEEDAFRHLPVGADRFDRASLLADLSPEHLAPWRHDPARVTSMVAKRVGATGPCGTSFSACSAAAQAIAEGLRTLRRGEADVAIVGGHDSMLHPFGLLSFVVLGALSATSCRPFDRNRDGFLIGEGAAMLVLETANHAKARGARIRARLLGAGTSADGYNATAPHPEGAGAEKAMRGALQDAGIEPSQIDYVNAHATGTPVGDIAESTA